MTGIVENEDTGSGRARKGPAGTALPFVTRTALVPGGPGRWIAAAGVGGSATRRVSRAP